MYIFWTLICRLYKCLVICCFLHHQNEKKILYFSPSQLVRYFSCLFQQIVPSSFSSKYILTVSRCQKSIFFVSLFFFSLKTLQKWYFSFTHINFHKQVGRKTQRNNKNGWKLVNKNGRKRSESWKNIKKSQLYSNSLSYTHVIIFVLIGILWDKNCFFKIIKHSCCLKYLNFYRVLW